MKVLTEDDVLKLLDWSVLIEALKHAYGCQLDPKQRATVPTRVVITGGRGSYLTMPALAADGWFGVKQVSVLPSNRVTGLPTVQAWYTLFDETGTPALALAATNFTNIRTAAVSALAAAILSSPISRTLLVIGTGQLSPWMAEAHCQVRRYDRILVWGRRKSAAERTVSRLNDRLHHLPFVKQIEVAQSIDEGLAEADVVTIATTATYPLIRGFQIRADQHIDAVGAFTPAMCEVDAETVMTAHVWVDDDDACREKAGDLISAQLKGWSFENVKGDLAKLVQLGSLDESSSSRSRVTLFKSVGTALSDLAFARVLAKGASVVANA